MKKMNECLFCKIARKEIPSGVVYEDAHTLAFLDHLPTAPGHTLVIPKKHATNIFDTSAETLARTMETVRKISPAVRDAVGGKGVHVNSNHGEAAGQIVMHLHFHIIPRHSRSEFEFWPQQPYEEGALETIAEKIKSALA